MHRRLVRRFGATRVRRVSWLLIALTFVALVATFVVRGPAAGADAEVYWTAARTWLAGGDPYDLPPDVLPYVYAPWSIPLFVPWALLPWDAAFTVWRLAILIGLAVTAGWAARRRPGSTAVLFVALSVPIGINLDTGNITLPLALLVFAGRFTRPWVAGAVWGVATGMKWATLPLGIILSRPARRAGLVTIGLTILASLALWPMTVDQLRTIAQLERPLPVDYLVLAWAAVPWLWTDPKRRRWLHPRTWARRARSVQASVQRTAGNAATPLGITTSAAGSSGGSRNGSRYDPARRPRASRRSATGNARGRDRAFDRAQRRR